MDELVKAHIPHRIAGEKTLLERAPIKDALAYCQVALNPHYDVAFSRILNVPARKLGAPARTQLCQAQRLLRASCMLYC